MMLYRVFKKNSILVKVTVKNIYFRREIDSEILKYLNQIHLAAPGQPAHNDSSLINVTKDIQSIQRMHKVTFKMRHRLNEKYSI